VGSISQLFNIFQPRGKRDAGSTLTNIAAIKYAACNWLSVFQAAVADPDVATGVHCATTCATAGYPAAFSRRGATSFFHERHRCLTDQSHGTVRRPIAAAAPANFKSLFNHPGRSRDGIVTFCRRK
jgi:hypothetical protein